MKAGEGKAASVLADAIEARDDELVAAKTFVLLCRVQRNDRKAAIDAALSAIKIAPDPAPFYRVLVRLRGDEELDSAAMVQALEYLRERYPSEAEWSERLGWAYFQRGDTERSVRLFRDVFRSRRLKDVKLRSLLMAAESARQAGNTKDAIRVLEAAYGLYPRRVSILNNLIYTLAQEGGDIQRARELLPKLLDLAPEETFAVMDTAALVCLKSGDLKRANEYMNKALNLLEGNPYGVLETRLSAAEIHYRLGRFEDAEDQIRLILRMDDIPDDITVGVRRLREKLESKE